MQFQFWGNYAGPGYTGGQYVAPGEAGDFTVPPTDALDALAQLHDIAYADAEAARASGDQAGYWRKIISADDALVKGSAQLYDQLFDKVVKGNTGPGDNRQELADLMKATGMVEQLFRAKQSVYNQPNRMNFPPTKEEQAAIDKFLWDKGLSLPQGNPLSPAADPGGALAKALSAPRYTQLLSAPISRSVRIVSTAT